MPGLQVLLEVFELIFGCLFGVEVVLRLWGIGWSFLEFKLKLFWVTQIELVEFHLILKVANSRGFSMCIRSSKRGTVSDNDPQ